MTQPYSGLVRVYDYLPAGIDYDTWADYLFSETGWRMRGCFKAFSLEQPSTQDRNIFYVIEREASA